MTKVAGVILAGGLSRRMGGGDKALRPLVGRPVLAHVIARARPQVAALVLNANGDPGRFAEFGLPVAPDLVEGFAGPLAGILTGLAWAEAEVPGCRWLASFACDAPFLPEDLVARMLAAVEAEGAELACAASRGRAHPVFGLWPLRLRADLEAAMREEEIRKVDRWTARHRLATVDFPEVETAEGLLDPFFNANRPEDLDEAARLAALLA
ncbi:MAG: molybdenum cofactor guanylyltransferase MobA [Kiloniellales bacterium]|nr:molybdenum cofactor guanylyltransferase MobA [Kiloniellales bacterium]